MNKKAIALIGLLALLIVPQGTVWASPITVQNYSFETDSPPNYPPWYTYTNYGSSNYHISDWTLSGSHDQGTFIPTIPGKLYKTSLPDGSHMAYSNGGTISQTLSATLTANVVYTLQVYVGDRLDSNFPGYAVELYAGSNLLSVENSLTPTRGQWLLSSQTYNATGSSPGLGEALTIKLVGNYVAGEQVNFDYVTLDASSVPLPSTVLLLGSGMVGLLALRRRKKSTP